MSGFEFQPSSTINIPKKEVKKPHPFLDKPFHGDTTKKAAETSEDLQQEQPQRPKMKLSFTSITEVPTTEENTTATFETKDYEVKAKLHRLAPAMRFGINPILMQSIEAHKKTQSSFEKEYAKFELNNLLQSGKILEITNFIAEDKKNIFFENEIKRIRNTYAEELELDNLLVEKDWRILTALELFDKGTFEHSIHTFKIAKQVLENGPAILRNSIEKEISLEVFYKACLFHDIGKFSIPKFILDSKFTDKQWIEIFLDMFPENDDQDEYYIKHKPPIIVPDTLREKNKENKNNNLLISFLAESKFRPVSVVPANMAFNTDEQLAIMKERGIDSNSSLLEIMAPHEKDSQTMLTKFGYLIEAILAGHHHNNNSENTNELPISREALQVIIELCSDTIHTIDVLSALSEKRTYTTDEELHNGARKYNVIINHVETGKIKNAWIPATIFKCLIESDEDLKKATPEEKEAIERFIRRNLPSETE